MSITDTEPQVPEIAIAPPPLEASRQQYEPDLPQPFLRAPPVRVGNIAPQEPYREEPEQTFWGKLRDSFEMDNDVVAAYDLFTRKQFPVKAGYDLPTHLEKDYPDLLLNNRENFAVSGSPEETDAIAARIRNEQAVRARQASSGAGGFISDAIAGISSPLSLAPYVRFAKMGREAVTAAALRRYGGGAAEGAVNVAAGALGQEMFLQGAQETRDQWETIANVGAGMVLGGMLGGGARFFSPVEIEKMRDMTRAVLEDAPLPTTRAEQYGPTTRDFALRHQITAYHGSMTVFDEFDPGHLGKNTNAPSAREGYFAAGRAGDATTAGSYLEWHEGGFDTRMLDDVGRAQYEQLRETARVSDEAGSTFWTDFRNAVEAPDEAFAAKYPQFAAEVTEGQRLRAATRTAVGDDVYAARKAYRDFEDKTIAPKVEAEFKVEASQRAREEFMEANKQPPQFMPGANIRPVRLRMENPLIFDQKGVEFREESYFNTIQEAKAAGHDGVIFKNTFDYGGGPIGFTKGGKPKQHGFGVQGKPDDVYVVFEPHQIRSGLDPIFFSEWGLRQYDEPIGPRLEKAANDDAVRSAELMRSAGAAEAPPARQSQGIMLYRGSDASKSWSKITSALLKGVSKTGPVARGMMSKNAAMRTTMTKLSDTGLTQQENALQLNELGEPIMEQYTVASGGTVENRSKSWYGNLARVVAHMDEQYLEYKTGKTDAKLFANLTQRFKDVAKDRARRNAGLGPDAAVFDQTVTWARVGLKDANGNAIPLTWTAMMEEAAKATRYDPTTWGEHPIKQVREIAAFYRKTIEEPILLVAEDAGLFKGLELDKDGIRHLWRDYNLEQIIQNQAEWMSILKQGWTERLTGKFNEELGKFREVQARGEEDAADALTTPENYEAAVGGREAALEVHRKAKPEFADVDDQLRLWNNAKRKEKAKEAPSATNLANIQGRIDGLKAKRDEFKSTDEYNDWVKTRNRLKNRLARVRASSGALEIRAARGMEEADTLERSNVDAFQKLMDFGTDIAAKADAAGDDVLDARLGEFKDQFEELAARYDAAEELRDPAGGDAQVARAEQMSRVAERIERLEAIDRAGVMAGLTDAIEAMALRVEGVAKRRTLRAAELRGRADPEVLAKAKEQTAAMRQRARLREDAFARKWEEIGEGAPGSVDLQAGTVDLAPAAQRIAEDVTRNITGSELTINPLSEMLAGERGAEKARMLTFVNDRQIEKFLHNDLDRLAKSYVRQMAPDIELKKVMGSLKLDDQIKEITADYERRVMLETDPDKKIALKREHDGELVALKIVIDRIRNRRGVPPDPSSWTYRLGSTAMLLNYTGMLGLQVLGSISDLGKSVFHMGFGRAYGDIVAPHVKALQDPEWGKFTDRAKDELFALGIGTDMSLDTHNLIQADMTQDLVYRKSIPGKLLEQASGRFGLISAMAPWNTVVRRSVGMAVIQRQMRGIEAMASGRATSEQTEELLRAGIDQFYARQIWRFTTESDRGGNEFVNGIWLPNSENWAGPDGSDARRALAAAVQRETNIINVQGNLNKPQWTDEHIGLRMLFQFRNFGWESLTRTLGAGLQQRDAAVLQGAVSMISLGMLSFAARSYLAGGETKREFQTMPWAAVIAKGLDTSGLMASFSDANRIAEGTAIGGLSNWMGAERRFPPDHIGLMSTVLGPAFSQGIRTAKIGSDLFEEAAQQMGADTSGGVNGYTVHNFRMLFPLQNAQPFANGFDAVEKGAVRLFGLEPRRDQ